VQYWMPSSKQQGAAIAMLRIKICVPNDPP
jgi:hypothetical protein